LRFVLKLFGASNENAFIDWLYRITEVFVEPFSGIFSEIRLGRFVIDLDSVIAMTVYMFVGFIFIEAINLFRPKKKKKKGKDKDGDDE